MNHRFFVWPVTAPRRMWGSIFAVAFLSATVAAMVTWFCPHVPREHDEFSNLLAADTILQGRLANPTPTVWEPLQTFHVIMEPAYAAKYPLAQGLMIAFGWWLVGVPIAGSWLAAGICTACITWMLAGVTSRRWAILGGVLVALHPAMQVTWSQSLFGGWLTAAGSALVAGGIFRLRRRVEPKSALAFGLGVALLALSRPFEGLVCTIISGLALWQLWRGDFQQRMNAALRCGQVACIPVFAALLLIAAQNRASTGHWWSMPYQVHEAKYGVAPLFVFGQTQRPELIQSGKTPRVVERYHKGWSLASYRSRVGFSGWLVGCADALKMAWDYWGLSLAFFPLILASFWFRYRLARCLAGMLVLQMVAAGSVCWIFPHYLSPILPWLVTLTVLGLRRALHRFSVSWQRPCRPVVAGLLLVQCWLLAVSVHRLHAEPNNAWAVRRADVEAALGGLAGKHLVLVKYAPSHNVHQEWVYNAADLESADIIWARDERPEWRRELLNEYSADRSVWCLEPDHQERPRLLSVPKTHRFQSKAIRLNPATGDPIQ